jgi:hypothetical protein
LVLLPENCQIKDNRFIRSTGGESVIGSLPDTQPPLDKIVLQANRYAGNILLGGTCAYAPAAAGCIAEAVPAGWSEERELAGWKPLTPEDVGPAWVVALRKAGQFAIEDDKSCYRAEPAKGEKKKKE